jgi:hypothetical protein
MFDLRVPENPDEQRDNNDTNGKEREFHDTQKKLGTRKQRFRLFFKHRLRINFPLLIHSRVLPFFNEE